MKRKFLVGFLAVLVFSAALTLSLLTAAAGPPVQETEETAAGTPEEPLPEFKPSERLPADSAVAFPTDI